MNKMENKIILFIAILTGLRIVNIFLSLFYRNVLHSMNVEFDEKMYHIIGIVLPYFINLIFAIILYIYCHLEIKNKIVIPILGFFYPVIGLVFYFIESELITDNYKKIQDEQILDNW